MNFVVLGFLYGQFYQLHDEFSKCIGEGGEFNGNFGQFRRHHQAVSRSVQEADRFLMYSNVAHLCCQIITIIFVFYSTVFYRHETLSLDHPQFAVVYISWLSVSILGLSLTAGQAIILNHVASIL